MAYQFQDTIRRSVTNGLTPASQARDFQKEVAKLIDVTTYIGCKACQMTCSKWNDIRDIVSNNVGMYDNLSDLNIKSRAVMRLSEVGQNNKLEWLICKGGCMHYFDPGCLKMRPAGGAIIQYANGVVDFQSEQYIGCGYYITDCPSDIPRLNPGDNRIYKYTLCADRMVAGQRPACVKTYPMGAIRFGTKESTKTLASERVAKLKTHGYGNAGLYDPASVSGIHVMYVLHRADKLNLYHSLPENPETSETVKFWKGAWKPFVAVGFAAIFVASIFHYVGVGLNRADEEENSLREEEDGKRK